jgi:hypothetical protein
VRLESAVIAARIVRARDASRRGPTTPNGWLRSLKELFGPTELSTNRSRLAEVDAEGMRLRWLQL